MRVINGFVVATLLAALMFGGILVGLFIFNRTLGSVTLSASEYILAGVAALVVFATFMWRIFQGASVREEADRFLDLVSDPGSSTD